ncbi:MAG: GNAT family N-acetyltransferase [Brevinematales bacterium]|nr:GNAT family N-acetyltransferase [Brevinematales bacterium]
MTYRKATFDDLSFMIEIEKKSFNDIDRFESYQIKHFIKNPHNSIITDIILINENKVGWATFFTKRDQNSIRLYTFCIDPIYRGKGYGKEYLKSRLKNFSTKFKKIFLEVRQSNYSAITLYQSLGFKTTRILKNYYLNEDGIKMELYF